MEERGKPKKCEIYTLVLPFKNFLKKWKVANCTINLEV